MCTVILLFEPNAVWPVLMAANRDEMLDRPWDPPSAYWPEQPDVVGGRDRLAGGTWLAVNGAGVVAAVLNRTGTLGPEAGKRSRGDLPLLALRHGAAEQAVRSLTQEEAGPWRGFNLVVADAGTAWFLTGLGRGRIEAVPVTPGFHMVTSVSPDDPGDPRIARHMPRFRRARKPTPPDWGDWPALLADGDGSPRAALNIPPTSGFGTSSSSLIALSPEARHFAFAAGPPGKVSYDPIPWPAPAGFTEDAGLL